MQLHEVLHHDGYGDEGGAPAFSHRVQRGGRLESAAEHDGRSEGQRELQPRVAPGVKERCGDHHPDAAAQWDPVDQRTEWAEPGRCRPAGTLRYAGRAGGQHDGPAVAFRPIQLTLRRAGDQLVDPPLIDALDVPGHRADQRRELVIMDHGAQLLLLGDDVELRPGKAGVHQDRVGAEHGQPDQRLDHADGIAAQHTHPVAGADAGTGVQPPGQPLDPVEQFAIGNTPLLVDDGDPPRAAGGGLPDFAVQAETPPVQRV